jgi:hypothetical protein
VGHASRSSGLLRMKACRARISQSGLKTGRRVTTGGARDTIAEVASESKLKTDGSMRQAASDSTTLALPFSFY